MIRARHYSRRTEEAYVHWIRRFVLFHGRRHPREMGSSEVSAFLSSLANEGQVAAATQNQALAATLFLYKAVLGVELPWMGEIARAKRPRRLPVVLTRQEVHALLGKLDGTHALMARLMYGTGLRMMECLRLRVKDVDLARRELIVREGKGGKDRITMFPSSLVEAMSAHLDQVQAVHRADRAAGVAGVELTGLVKAGPRAGVVALAEKRLARGVGALSGGGLGSGGAAERKGQPGLLRPGRGGRGEGEGQEAEPRGECHEE